MVSKADFSPVEWKKIVQSPLLAGFAVSVADPHGFFSSLKEAFSEAKMLGEAKASASEGSLAKTIADELLTASGRHEAREGIRTIAAGASTDQMKTRAIDALKEASSILEAKAPNDAKAFKAWLTTIARTVAEASGDGFMGFGGVKVNEAEKATIAEISQALGA